MTAQGKKLLLLCLLGALAFWLWHDRTPGGPPAREPPALPKKGDDAEPKRKPLLPWRPKGDVIEAGGRPQLGGRKAPDGTAELTVDLPAELCKHNIASKGLGCCVFRSINYAGLWQSVPEVVDLPEKMKQAGIAGGGWPEKVDQVMAKFAPNVQYLQDTNGDAELLEAIIKSGRMACVTYAGRDNHYSGSIAHMVCCPYYDRKSGWVCILDNNFPEDGQREWMSPAEFAKRWQGGGGSGWTFALLAPAPPPPPHN